ncbi:uncharacterized protein PHALS_01330 [Plasmopara halstedii]|uniref:Uncharacterized protein n=1 Tax=Plasmopara halstedii TaxID=4781 RepID=A0A0P1AT58_PLAHL|nr:uncharacterized protein PHALS_01330 [Plasmopara halstedii]CEG45008.1 hypothetical protein PHALS_01330 [Plasmopara halstedii]|eukprot:XP_024581377.1 hypothetical protein PHALS_01330 [Plasmopara halstedii]
MAHASMERYEHNLLAHLKQLLKTKTFSMQRVATSLLIVLRAPTAASSKVQHPRPASHEPTPVKAFSEVELLTRLYLTYVRVARSILISNTVFSRSSQRSSDWD